MKQKVFQLILNIEALRAVKKAGVIIFSTALVSFNAATSHAQVTMPTTGDETPDTGTMTDDSITTDTSTDTTSDDQSIADLIESTGSETTTEDPPQEESAGGGGGGGGAILALVAVGAVVAIVATRRVRACRG